MQAPDSTRLELRPVTTRPYNAETPLGALIDRVTPTRLFFVRNHFDIPVVNADEWELTVTGEVERPLRIRLDELRSLPSATIRTTLECAGNGRQMMKPSPGGTPWGLGATSTALFTGVRLLDVLERAGVTGNASELVFTGVDAGVVETGAHIAFARSIPIREITPDILLAVEINGEPLTPDHGYPVRLVAPGRYGVDSVKWLARIEAVPEPFRGYFQCEEYIYDDGRGAPEPIGPMRPRALITSPAAGASLAHGIVVVEGTAWSGGGPVERVEVSTDGGATWHDAEVAPPEPGDAGASQRWRMVWQPVERGAHTLLARATDSRGATQPIECTWNRLGYCNNRIQQIEVTLR